MNLRTIEFFTEKEEECVNLFIRIGIPKNVAKLLVFFATTPEATSRDLEIRVDLRQSEVSMAIKYMTKQGWIISSDIPSPRKSRSQKIHTLHVPVRTILVSLEKKMKSDFENQFTHIRKITSML